MLRIITLLLIGAVLSFGANQLYQKKTRFGLLAKFTSPTFSSCDEWDLPPLPADEQSAVDAILTQKFTFLARGSQAFAFVSEDGNYILKLFKQHKWHPKNLFGYLPLPFNPYYRDYLQRQKKQHGVLSSCMAALTHVKEHTGVLYAHLNPTPVAVTATTLVDKHGKIWTLDLSKSCFLLQKKADLFYPYIQARMQDNDIEGAKEAIRSTLALLGQFFEMGVYENNVILRKNFGFIDNTPVQFDIGKFKFDPQKKCDKNEIRILVKGFYRWIGNNYPELIPVFDETLDNVCAKEDILKEKKSTFS